jgi:NADPH-dependent 2,4-dienoyl-CoA reductase/sulfur reductase-like enzyme
MSNLHVKYLLVGGGLASSSTAEAIRAVDPIGEMMLIGQEAIRPYHRPPLSKGYLRTRDRHELFTLPPEWFSLHHAQLHTGLRVSQLDTARSIAGLENGQEVSFDKLLIATGMSPAHLSIPGADLPNLYYLRTLHDVDRLHNAADQALRDGRPYTRDGKAGRGVAVVIGGGVLGVELAATLTQLGLSIHLVVSKPHPWDKFAGDHTGGFITRYLESRGIIVHSGIRIRALEGDGRVQRVALNETDSIACDFALAAVGSVVNKELLRGTPITAEKAILVDDHCRTNLRDIYAAGDCCAVFDPLFGKHRLLDHWENAVETGKVAGANMAGQDVRYQAVNHFFSDVFELSLNGWGESRQVERRLIRGNTTTDAPDFIELGVAADGRIAQVLAINHAGEDELLASLVGQRASINGHEELLRDPSFSLSTLLK